MKETPMLTKNNIVCLIINKAFKKHLFHVWRIFEVRNMWQEDPGVIYMCPICLAFKAKKLKEPLFSKIL